MKFQRTQIYLDPDDHRRLTDEAHRRGVSLAALLREIIRERLAPRSSRGPHGWDDLIGIIDWGEPTDIALHEGDYRADTLDARFRKKMGYLGEARSERGRRAHDGPA
jgi:hypothetical protein